MSSEHSFHSATQLDALAPELVDTLASIQLLALDVDGTLTAGQILYDDAERESQIFHAWDGQGLRWLLDAGVQVVWITGRGSQATQRRASELNITELHMASGPKQKVLQEIQLRLALSVAHTASMGDDLPDLELAQQSAFFGSPCNARPEVQARAHWTSQLPAGAGAVRELCELILNARQRKA